MRTPSGRITARLGVLAALVVAAVQLAMAAAPEGGTNAAVEAARDIWELIQQIRGEGPDTTRAGRAPAAGTAWGRTAGARPSASPAGRAAYVRLKRAL